MDRVKIIVLSVALIILAIRLYQKYIKREKDKTKYGSGTLNNTSPSHPTKEDDYEPYSNNENNN